MKVSAVIVTYNSEKTIKECIKGIKESCKDTEIIVVDSNSSDQTIEKIKDSDCKIIQLGENVGYGKGNNIGVKAAKGEYILILNPDVVIEKNTIPTLVKECKEGIIVSPKVLLKDRRINYFGADINFLGFGTIRHFGKEDNIKVEKEETTSITGGCFLTRKKDYLSFDDDYFMYNDDTDYSIRALQKGYKLIVTNKTFVTHLQNLEDFKLNKFKYYYDERNRYVTVIKNLGLGNIIGLALFEPVMITHAVLTGNIKERFRIYAYLVKNFWKIMDKRNPGIKLSLGCRMNIEKFIHLPMAKTIDKTVNLYSKIIYKIIS